MQNDFALILQSFNMDIEDPCLKELYDCFQYTGNNSSFLFDLETDKCHYLCPCIRNILGYTNQKFIEEGFLFLKTIIDPRHFSYLLTEIITLVKITENIKDECLTINSISLPFRIKHKNGQWINLITHLRCVKGISTKAINILIGFIEKDVDKQDENFTDDFNITFREKEVLKYLAAGNSSKKIASELFISENTVITHRRHLIQKLKVKNSAELIKKGFELNILN